MVHIAFQQEYKSISIFTLNYDNKIIQQNLAIKRYQTVITRYVISTKNTF